MSIIVLREGLEGIDDIPFGLAVVGWEDIPFGMRVPF
jgi:hypothetical protein